MGKNKIRAYGVLAILLVVFSAVAFLLPFGKNAVFWLAYAFGVLAIGLQVIVLRISFEKEATVKSKFYGFPIAGIGFVYLIVQVIASVLFFCLSSITPVRIPVIVFVLIIAIAAVGLITTDAMRDEIERQDKQLNSDVVCMQELRSKAASLPELCEDDELKKVLLELADKFQYSDPVSSDVIKDMEDNLTVLVKELQSMIIEGDLLCVEPMCKKITALLDERNRLCKLNKGK
ncbi:MAG: hypothetical protein K2I07_11895 [Lachnospiraceae bacterium]|nr:hypothetical protein [Lachnospiraceae bacterium]